MHAISRKGMKRRELNDVELRDILSDILPLVRVDHIIPSTSDVLCQAIRRGLISSPPSHMIAANHSHNKVHAWIRSQIGLFVRPRLFMPYYEEIKVSVVFYRSLKLNALLFVYQKWVFYFIKRILNV